MPSVCKLLPYDYGSSGLLGYYHAQLNDIVQYPKTKTDNEISKIDLLASIYSQVWLLMLWYYKNNQAITETKVPISMTTNVRML